MEARNRWSFSLGAALAPDSNIGSGSEERIIYIHVFGRPLPFERNAEELTTSGIGVSVWGGAEYQVPLAERWRLRADGEAARREYGGSEFDRLFLATHLGPRWLADPSTAASLLASARQRWTGTAPDNRELGARLEVGHRVSPQVTVSGRASWHDRRYRNRPTLDGPVMDASLSGFWVVTPTLRAELSAGYGQERPQSLTYRNRSRWLGAGVSVILPLGFTVGGGGQVRWTDFEDEWMGHTPAGRGPGGPHPQPAALASSSGVDALRLQPGAGGGARGAGNQRAALRLPAHARRAALRAAVLGFFPQAVGANLIFSLSRRALALCFRAPARATLAWLSR